MLLSMKCHTYLKGKSAYQIASGLWYQRPCGLSYIVRLFRLNKHVIERHRYFLIFLTGKIHVSKTIATSLEPTCSLQANNQ